MNEPNKIQFMTTPVYKDNAVNKVADGANLIFPGNSKLPKQNCTHNYAIKTDFPIVDIKNGFEKVIKSFC